MSNRTALREAVRALSCELQVGDTSNVVCPACSGGMSGDESLSMTRLDDGVLYNCYRAGCGFRGFEGSSYALRDSKKKVKQFRPKKFTAPTGYLLPPHYKDWMDKFGIEPYDLDRNGVLSIVDRDTYMMPTMNERGYVTGCQDKAFWGRKPKVIGYKFMDFPSLSFAYTNQSLEDSPLLLVEDMISAIKGSKFMPTAALLGTNISEKEINYLKKLTNTVWLALDEDATAKAVAYKRKYNLYFRNFRVIPLTKDIKNMSYDAIERLLT